jgi:hypothetical protein
MHLESLTEGIGMVEYPYVCLGWASEVGVFPKPEDEESRIQGLLGGGPICNNHCPFTRPETCEILDEAEFSLWVEHIGVLWFNGGFIENEPDALEKYYDGCRTVSLYREWLNGTGNDIPALWRECVDSYECDSFLDAARIIHRTDPPPESWQESLQERPVFGSSLIRNSPNYQLLLEEVAGELAGPSWETRGYRNPDFEPAVYRRPS